MESDHQVIPPGNPLGIPAGIRPRIPQRISASINQKIPQRSPLTEIFRNYIEVSPISIMNSTLDFVQKWGFLSEIHPEICCKN